MALSKNINLDKFNTIGMQINNAYHVIVDMQGNSPMVITVGIFWDRDSYKQNKVPLEIKRYEFTPNYEDTSENIKKQFYNYALTLMDFESASAVLEDGQEV